MEPVTIKEQWMSNAIYDKLKYLALVLLPGLGTLYFTLGNLWNFKNVDAVVGTLTAIDAFLGVLLKLSTNNFNASDTKYAGDIKLTTNEVGTKVYSLELNGPIEALDDASDVVFRISPH